VDGQIRGLEGEELRLKGICRVVWEARLGPT
jgi:hypothetical protein